MSKFIRRFGRSNNEEAHISTTGADVEFVAEGNLKFAVEQGGNGSGPSYQEVSGAPVEVHSPLGYAVGPITIMFLNISKMVGTGVYSTRKFHWYSISSIKHLLTLLCDSCCCFIWDWFGWCQLDILVYWLSHCCELIECISRVRILLSKSIGVGGRLSRTSISQAEIPVPAGFRSTICYFVLQ